MNHDVLASLVARRAALQRLKERTAAFLAACDARISIPTAADGEWHERMRAIRQIDRAATSEREAMAQLQAALTAYNLACQAASTAAWVQIDLDLEL
jgi:hypothetical protein